MVMRDCWERSSEQAVFVSVLWDIPGITMPVFGLHTLAEQCRHKFTLIY